MTTVGLKELKAQLSQIVGRVAQGETVLVTDRGFPVAVLGPVSEELRALDDLQRRGRLRWSGGKPVRIAAGQGRRRPEAISSISKLVVENRKR